MKKNNKGFSLVELIIVIAIMAILAGAIAPALIRYIDKSRKSNDVSAAKSIKTAVETALAAENAYEELTAVEPNYIKITANASAASAITADTGYNSSSVLSGSAAKDSIFASLSNKTPKFNYKKAATTSKGTPDYWIVEVNGNDVKVGIMGSGGNTTSVYWLSPEVDEDYQ